MVCEAPPKPAVEPTSHTVTDIFWTWAEPSPEYVRDCVSQ